ncbi:MAG: HNH endonuclease [Proteobacteria bacterium]|nr:HNH endonuclease [Pseudomonadota bacterium]MBU4296104.1 HNH endonuclease [Pseudomonadota bacterium]MCG2746747.1 HNH endonuclease [Desulfobulbaceae bacterium]
MTETTSSGRPPIPAELRRRVLIEAGHRCAIPVCRETEIDLHHIIPWEECKEHAFDNLVALCPNCHRRAHKGEIDRKSLRLYKNSLSSICDHGVIESGLVVLSRSEGALHLLTVGGNITITTSGWTHPVDTLVLKITNGGSYVTTWEGFKSLPFTSGFMFTANGTDIIELRHYDGEVHFHPVSTPISK